MAAFEGFELAQIDVGETRLRVRRGGSGPPLVLLHGAPQTHMMWGQVAGELAQDFTVVAPDLRGYGGSGKVADTPDHAGYSKRAMARDIVALMQGLGFERFDAAGHDRGGRVAFRLALDHPERVRRLCVLDIVPTSDMYERMDVGMALGLWNWIFLAQPAPLPERTIAADDGWLMMRDGAIGGGFMTEDALQEYAAAMRDPATVHAMCEDYRAGVALDWPMDAADKGVRKIACPVLALWGAQGVAGRWFDVLETWRAWADDVRGWAVEDCGHFIPEQKPAETLRAFREFFGEERA